MRASTLRAFGWPRVLAVPLAVALVSAATTASALAAAGAAPQVVSARSGSAVRLPKPGGVLTTVVALPLTKGSWTISSTVSAANTGAGDFVRCRLSKATTPIDGGATTYLADSVGAIANSATVKAGSALTVTLECSHDVVARSAKQFSVLAGAMIIAVKGGPIVGPTRANAAGGTPTVVQQRTTAATALSTTDSTVVASTALGAGTWVLRANLSAVSFGGDGIVRCGLVEQSAEQTSTTIGVGSAADLVAEVVVQAVVQLDGPSTLVGVACLAEEVGGMYVDPGATLTATLAAPTDVVHNDLSDPVGLAAGAAAPTTVVSIAVPAGDWRVASIAPVFLQHGDGTYGGVTDRITCRLLAGAKAIGGGAAVKIVAGQPPDAGTLEQVALNSATFTSSKPWTLNLVCSHDAATPANAAWFVSVDSPIIAVQQGPISSSVV